MGATVEITKLDSLALLSPTVRAMSLTEEIEEKISKFTLDVGNNFFKVIVTSSDKSKNQEFILKVIREKSSNTDLNDLSVEGYEIVPSYTNKENLYEVSVPYTQTKIVISAEKTEVMQTITGLGEKTLNVGTNEYEIIVTAENGTTRTIKITINREKSNDASIANVGVKGYSLTHLQDNIYYVEIPYSVENIEIENISTTEATVNGIGVKEKVDFGTTDYEVEVISGDGTKRNTYIIRIIKEKDTVNTLSSLSLTNCTLSPAFASGTTSYTCTVANSVTSTKVSATATSSVATVTGTGSKTLNVGNNTVEVVVKAQDDTTKTYTVVLNRLPNSDATLKSLTLSSGTLSPTFNKETISYTVTVPYSVDNITLSGETTQTTSNVEGLGSKVLNVGENTFEVKVTAEDKTEKTYTIVINRLKDTDTSLKSIGVTNQEIVKVDNNHYTLTVGNSVTSVEVYAEATSKVAMVSGTGTVDLKVGANKVDVIVTAQDSTVSVYEVVITRLASSDATLKSLTLSKGTLSPAFASGTTSYTATVAYSVTNLTVTPTVNNSEASATVTGNTEFKVGTNTVEVKVTAGDGTEKIYTITVTRNKDTTATLKSLSLTDCTLSPTFVSGTTSYTCTVENSVTKTTVSAQAKSSVAKSVTGTGEKALSVGENTVEVKVTAQSGATKTYTVKVTRKANSDATLKGLTLSSGTLSPTFASGTTSYTATVPYSVTSLTVTGAVNNSEASATVSGNTGLVVGENTIIVKVTAGDGTEKIYTIIVTRQQDNDATLKSLKVTGYSLSPTFASATKNYTLTVEASSIEITAEANSSVAKSVIGTGTKTLNWGTNTASIIVTSQSGSVKTYKITVTNTQPTAPTITGGSSNWVSTAPTISVSKAGSAISGIKHYEYYKSTSSTAPTNATLSNGTQSNGTTATSTTSGNLTVSDEGTSYVWYRTVSNNGFKSNWTSAQTIKLDKSAPSIPTITYNGGSNSCSWKNNYNLTLSSSDNIGIAYYQIDHNQDGTVDRTNIASNFIPENGYSTCTDRYRAVDHAGNVSGWTAAQHIHMDTQAPSHTNWWWGEVTKDVARLYIQTTDNVGISSVQCPTSTQSGGYGNWHWFQGVWDSSANAYRCDITPSTFGHYGQTYQTHLYINDHAGNGGYYNQTSVGIPASCSYGAGTYWDFAYTGGTQSFTVPCSGTYKLEVWGAQGGTAGNKVSGGLGGYSVGNTTLSSNTTMYVVVGGAGADCTVKGDYGDGAGIVYAGGYNGGGGGSNVRHYQSGGGGATHIGTFNNTLVNHGSTSGLFIVAGGGGGSGYDNDSSYGIGGSGGGYNGGNGTDEGNYSDSGYYGIGGSQTSGGYLNSYGAGNYAGRFGQGADSSWIYNSSGGGGGLYGGGAGGGWCGAGGGSGYIGGVTGGSMSNGVRSGHGYARITLVSVN